MIKALAALLEMDLVRRLAGAVPHYRQNYMSRKRGKVKGWMRDPKTGRLRR